MSKLIDVLDKWFMKKTKEFLLGLVFILIVVIMIFISMSLSYAPGVGWSFRPWIEPVKVEVGK